LEALFHAIGPGVTMLLVVAVIILPSLIKIVQEWERGVIFRLGKYDRTRGPGLVFLIPGLEKMIKVDLRVITMEVPPQEVITRDNVTIKVNAVIYFRIIAPENAIIKVLDYVRATSQIAQTTLRSILGQSDLDELLAHREKINEQLQTIIDEQTEPWGIKVSTVEIKDVELPQTMQRAMAKQAEAEREKRAKVIHAEGEFQAAQQLYNAANVISQNPAAMQLRYMQTLTEIAVEKSSTILFPVPIDTLAPFLRGFGAPTPPDQGKGKQPPIIPPPPAA
jgi:regulator of protease activity HflC (stomatin/prohibitin superfamily)